MDLRPFTRSLRRIASVSACAAALTATTAPPVLAQTEPVVEAQALGALDLWSAQGRDTGLGADLWAGTSPTLARTVLAQERPMTAAFAELARRAWATGARAPDGAGQDSELAALRARALLAAGDAEAVRAIMARTPRVEASEPLSRAQAQAELALNRLDDACATGERLQENREGAWWLKLRAACLAASGSAAAAQVTLDLWRQVDGKDQTFDRLFETVVSGGTARASLSDPLHYALSRKLGLDLAPALNDAAPAVLAAVARDPTVPPAVRREAAYRALRAGVITGEAARLVYTPPEALGAPALTDAAAPPAPSEDVAALAKRPGAEGEAALSTLAAVTGDFTVREAAVLALLRRTKGAAEFEAVARLVRPRVAELAATGAPLQDPMLLATAAAAAGDAETARTLRVGIEQNVAPGATPLDLALLDALITAVAREPGGPALDRLVERGGVGEAAARRRAQTAALLLSAAGRPMTAQARTEFAAFDLPAPKASATRLAALEAAGAERRRGETVLLALGLAQQQGAALTPADRAAAITALRRAGLADDAARLTAEGLLQLIRP